MTDNRLLLNTITQEERKQIEMVMARARQKDIMPLSNSLRGIQQEKEGRDKYLPKSPYPQTGASI